MVFCIITSSNLLSYLSLNKRLNSPKSVLPKPTTVMFQNGLRGRPLQYFVFAAGSQVAMICGLHLGWPSPSLPHLLNHNSTIPITNDEGSWLASIFLMGAITGCLLSGVTFNLLGRRNTLLLTCPAFFMSWLVVAFASTIWELYAARFGAGICDGLAFCCIPLFLAEICDPKIRGLLISGVFGSYLFGTMVINLFGSFFNITVTALIAAGFSAVAGVFCLFVPESPHYNVIRGDLKMAMINMEKFCGGIGNVEEMVDSIKTAVKQQDNIKCKWLQLFVDSSNRRTLLLLAFLRTIQMCSGYTGVMFYAQQVFKETEEGVKPIVFVSVYYCLQITTSIINAVIIDKVGRRPLLISSMLIVIVALSVLSTYFTLENVFKIKVTGYSWFPIFGLFLFIVGYATGIHNVVMVLAGEVFPLHVKGCAIGILDIIFGVMGTAVSKFFQQMKDLFGMHVPFIAFALCILGGLPFVILYVPETKRKTLDEIQNQLRSKRKPKPTS